MDDFFRVKGTLLRRSLRASFSVPPYMATCVAISMSVLISVFINCKETYASVLPISSCHRSRPGRISWSLLEEERERGKDWGGGADNARLRAKERVIMTRKREKRLCL